MEEQARGPYQKLSRQEASDAVAGLGWRLVLGELRTEVRTGSLPLAADVAGRAAAVAGADGHLRLDVRADRVIVSRQTAAVGWVTERDVELARRISAVAAELRLHTTSGVGQDDRSVQVLEIGIDPLGQGPAVWFQRMDAPRPQRNRIHFDVSVPHDEAEPRIQAALAAGGTLIYDAEAPAFWLLADAEGNEACITTWQGRDGWRLASRLGPVPVAR